MKRRKSQPVERVFFSCYTQPRMTQLKPEEVDHLAKLARVSLSKDESEQFSKQLPEILDFVDQLQDAKVTDQPETNTVSQEQLRDDIEGGDSLTLDQLKKLAPQWQDNQVVVPPVFGESNDA